jgi:hypothetical protein
MLAANEAKPGRDRLTLIRLFEELGELGYAGGYDAVRRYARAWHRRHAVVSVDAYVPLTFAPGEAYQFDWSFPLWRAGNVRGQYALSTTRIFTPKWVSHSASTKPVGPAPTIKTTMLEKSGP